MMGVEWYFIDSNRKQYVEFGKCWSAQDIFQLMKEYKKLGKDYRSVLKELKRDSWFCDVEDTEYKKFLENKFFKAVYLWFNPEDTVCYCDTDFFYVDNCAVDFNEEYTCVASRYMSSNGIDSICPMTVNFSAAWLELQSGGTVARKSDKGKIFSMKNGKLFVNDIVVKCLDIDLLNANDWIVL